MPFQLMSRKEAKDSQENVNINVRLVGAEAKEIRALADKGGVSLTEAAHQMITHCLKELKG